jgi:ATP-binding cassette subfamily B protein
MDLLRIYARVLALLGPEARLGWLLALGNLALAAAQFAEPVLFGRIIDALAGTARLGGPAAPSIIAGLVAAWVAFGLFAIAAGVSVALHADRLAHRRRHAVLTMYFEHVLQLPLAFHGGSHSGRLMKVMLSGTDALWSLWLDFFRDSFAATMMITVILPLSLLLNWRPCSAC